MLQESVIKYADILASLSSNHSPVLLALKNDNAISREKKAQMIISKHVKTQISKTLQSF